MMEEYVFAIWKKNTNLVNHIFETKYYSGFVPARFVFEIYNMNSFVFEFGINNNLHYENH